jgi:predicted nuclease with TOPRIM domain
LSDTKGGSDPKIEPKSENPTAKVSTDQLAADNAALQIERDGLLEKVGKLEKALKEANDVLEAQAKEKFIKDILPRSKFTPDELSSKSLEELEHIRVTLDQAITPTYKNIHFPPVAGDQNIDRDTVGDLSIVTKAKREPGRT